MGTPEATIFQLFVCLGILCLFVVHQWMRPAASVGLPLCYVISLAMIHWLGALIHVLPWYSPHDPFTYDGFRQAFWGSLAFATGSILVAPFALRTIFGDRYGCHIVETVRPDQLRLPKIYLLAGLAFYTVLAPAVARIPSIAAVTVCGVYLTVVGLCLACWRAHIQRRLTTLVAWLLVVSSIPFFTVITLGFVGYGALAALLVFTFVSTYYRPRWQAAVALGLLIFLGLSLFVTYARDRTTLRKTVWGGADYADRLEALATTLTDFEVIDFRNSRHLRFINMRLNQNFLVGRAVDAIEMRREQYAKGETLYGAFLALVPRIIWRDKPVRAGSGNIVSRFTGISFDRTTSVGIGQVMEFYINFGTPGVVAGFLIIGVLIRVLDALAALRLHEGDWQGFMSWFLPSISILNVGGSLVEVFGTAAASLVLVMFVNKVFVRVISVPEKRRRCIPVGYRTQTLETRP